MESSFEHLFCQSCFNLTHYPASNLRGDRRSGNGPSGRSTSEGNARRGASDGRQRGDRHAGGTEPRRDPRPGAAE